MAAESYAYKALNEDGVHVEGVISASSEADATTRLLDRGLMVLEIGKPRADRLAFLRRFRQQRVPLKEVILFSKQFRTLFNAGVPLTELLRILQNQTENKRLQGAIADIGVQISGGHSLYEAFNLHRDIFPNLYCTMIKAGENSGALGDVLDRLTYLLSHEEQVNKRIASALRYPKLVVIFMTGAFLVLLNMVIPQFANIFKAAHLTLPLPTRVAIGLNAFMVSYWWLCVAAAAAAIMGFRWWSKTPRGRLALDRLALRLPIIGSVVQKSMIARFAAIFCILQRSGVSVLDSIGILNDTLDNAAMSAEFLPVRDKLTAGQGLAEPLRSVRYFSPLAINMIAVGESSGNMEKMMEELATHYDEEVEYAIGQMTEAIGPVLLLGLGVVVLFFALAIFLPMWDMTQLAR